MKRMKNEENEKKKDEERKNEEGGEDYIRTTNISFITF